MKQEYQDKSVSQLKSKKNRGGSYLEDNRQEAVQRKPNNTGLPDNLKNGIENLSGHSMDDVKVHYNSSKPAQLNAHAYAQGNQIHLASGQEKHLPHEAWHVVQQKQGRVKPTMQLKGTVPVNDDSGLEKEADVMGSQSLNQKTSFINNNYNSKSVSGSQIVQRVFKIGDKTYNKGIIPAEIRSHIGANLSLYHIAESWANSDKVEAYKNASEAILAALRFHDIGVGGYSQVDDPLISEELDIDNIEVDKSASALADNYDELNNKFHGINQKVQKDPKNGYIGTSIVYANASADQLAKKYVKGGQDWSTDERKARLGVNFGINKFSDFDPATNNEIEASVKNKSDASYNSTKDDVTTQSSGFTWGYSYSIGSHHMTTKEWRMVFKKGEFHGRLIKWLEGGIRISMSTALEKFRNKRKSTGIPYGFMRGIVSARTHKVENQLKSNNADPVYIHSLDGDAPNFITLKHKGSGVGWKKVLDAYDEILAGKTDSKGKKGAPMLIGGYNLLEDHDKYSKPSDHAHTIRSNVIDLAIRQAVHKVAPTMTYPTEPNFLIRTDTYKAASANKSMLKGEAIERNQKSPWGNMAVEGRLLYNNVIKHAGIDANKDIEYNPLASVATGVSDGGARLKIEKGKQYTEDSISAKPQYDFDSEVGSEISIQHQYIVQAQSLAGAGRLAYAYRKAFEVVPKDKRDGVSTKDLDELPMEFQPVEEMVLQLLNNQPVKIAVGDTIFDKVEGLSLKKILLSIEFRLKALQNNSGYKALKPK